MTSITSAELRSAYLGELDAALGAIPYGVASELRSAIAESLSGLDPEQTAARIAELGDPAEVAAAAAAATESSGDPVHTRRPATASAEPRRYLVDTRGFALAGAIALGVAGIALPFFGWIVGASLVTSSRFWYRWEKAVAILAPIAGVALSLLVSWLTVSSPEAAGPNPLLPAGLDGIWVTSVVVAPLTGIWLLLRLRGRAAPVTLSRLDRALGAQSDAP